MTELSGLVAILNEAGDQVAEYRDLGPDPVAVRPGAVLPVDDQRPDLGKREQYGEPVVTVMKTKVKRVWPVVAAPVELPDLQPYQFFAMLDLSGKRTAVDAYLEALPEPQRTIGKAKLDHTVIFHRHDELVDGAQQAIGLSDAELDALWSEGAAIQ